MIPFKDEGDPQKEKIFAEISHPEEEGDLADIKSSLVNESEIIPASNGHEVSGPPPRLREAWRVRESGGKEGRRRSPADGPGGAPLAGGGLAGLWSASFLCVCRVEAEGRAGKLVPSGSLLIWVAKPLVCGQEKLPSTLDASPSDLLSGAERAGALERGCLSAAAEKFFRGTEDSARPLPRWAGVSAPAR